MSCRFSKDGEEDQVYDSEMEAKDAIWKSITGLALMNALDPEKQSTKFDYLFGSRYCFTVYLSRVYQILRDRVYGGLLEKHFLFTSLSLCLIMSKRVLNSSQSY